MDDLSVKDFVAALAARTPTPGGGSAAAAAAAMGAGLLAMAARFAHGKKSNPPEADARLAEACRVIDGKIALLTPMMARDAAAFEIVTDAYRLPKATEEAAGVRERAIQKALVGAMAVPEETIHVVRDVLEGFATVAQFIGRNIVSDVGCGTHALRAAAEMARLNVQVNTAYLKDRPLAEAATGRVEELMAEIRRDAERNDALVKKLLDPA